MEAKDGVIIRRSHPALFAGLAVGATGAITQTGETATTAILAKGGTTGSLAVVSATGDVTLTNDSNDVSKLAGNVVSTGKFLRYTDANALDIDTVTAAGTGCGAAIDCEKWLETRHGA